MKRGRRFTGSPFYVLRRNKMKNKQKSGGCQPLALPPCATIVMSSWPRLQNYCIIYRDGKIICSMAFEEYLNNRAVPEPIPLRMRFCTCMQTVLANLWRWLFAACPVKNSKFRNSHSRNILSFLFDALDTKLNQTKHFPRQGRHCEEKGIGICLNYVWTGEKAA